MRIVNGKLHTAEDGRTYIIYVQAGPSLSFRLQSDWSNCGLAHLHTVSVSCSLNLRDTHKQYKALYEWLVSGGHGHGLPLYDSGDDRAYVGMIAMTGSDETRTMEFADWVAQHHPDRIVVNNLGVKNPNSGRFIRSAILYCEEPIEAHEMAEEDEYYY